MSFKPPLIWLLRNIKGKNLAVKGCSLTLDDSVFNHEIFHCSLCLYDFLFFCSYSTGKRLSDCRNTLMYSYQGQSVRWIPLPGSQQCLINFRIFSCGHSGLKTSLISFLQPFLRRTSEIVSLYFQMNSHKS